MAQPDPLIGHALANQYFIDDYVRDEELGRVYAARQVSDGRRVSVKVLHQHLVSDPVKFARFGREMVATASVSHPNAINMVNFGNHREVFHYIVLEHVEAPSLKETLAAEKRLKPERVAHISAQIAACLGVAHREGVVHRNLSSENILLVPTRQGDLVKIRDFGLSRLQDPEEGDTGLTEIGTRVGSYEYMAPEYIHFGKVDYRGDLYSLGILMYEMLMGQPPFQGRAGEIMDMHVEQPMPKPRGPRWLVDLVLELTQKNPRDRTPSGEHVVAALEAGVGHSLAAPDPNEQPKRTNPVLAFTVWGCLGFTTVTAFGLVAVALAAGLYANSG